MIEKKGKQLQLQQLFTLKSYSIWKKTCVILRKQNKFLVVWAIVEQVIFSSSFFKMKLIINLYSVPNHCQWVVWIAGGLIVWSRDVNGSAESLRARHCHRSKLADKAKRKRSIARVFGFCRLARLGCAECWKALSTAVGHNWISWLKKCSSYHDASSKLMLFSLAITFFH